MKVYFEKDDKVRELSKEEVIQIVGTPIEDFCELSIKLRDKHIFIVDIFDNLAKNVDKYKLMLLGQIDKTIDEYILINVGNNGADMWDDNFKKVQSYNPQLFPSEKYRPDFTPCKIS